MTRTAGETFREWKQPPKYRRTKIGWLALTMLVAAIIGGALLVAGFALAVVAIVTHSNTISDLAGLAAVSGMIALGFGGGARGVISTEHHDCDFREEVQR